MSDTKVITGPRTVFSYANVWDPKPSLNGGKPKYSVSLIIKKSDTKTIDAIKKAIKAAYEEGEGKLKGTSKVVPALSDIKTPLRDGDKDRAGDPAYAGSYFINCNSDTAPDIVDAQCNPVMSRSDCYSGCVGRASINLYAYNTRDTVKAGNYNLLYTLYDSVPEILSELIRTALIPRDGYKFIVADFSAIEARVLSWLAKEEWRMDVFAKNGDIYCETASRMFHKPVVKNGINGELRAKGKQCELSCGYGGSVGALRNMGAIEAGMKEEELQPLVDMWRESNPKIVSLWYDIDSAAKRAIMGKTTTTTHGIKFECRSGMMFIHLPSGRMLSYVRPKIGINRFGSDSITYEGVDTNKHWGRLETFGGKLTENIIQALSRDILCYAMQNLSDMFICAHIHDEVVIECPMDMTVDSVCDVMAQVPSWADGLVLKAEGFESMFYKKE